MADIQNISLDSPGSVGAVAVPVVFALIFLLGMVGNGLVLAVLLQPGPSAWQEPGSTTDLFILNLAVADLCFILCCVPFQAAIYTLDAWLFGAFVCKTVHLLIYLTMYASSFTLAAVSVDRQGEWDGEIKAVAALYALCWGPHHALILCFWYGRFAFSPATYACRLASHCLAYANSCLNPLVYSLASRHFRARFRRLWPCGRRRHRHHRAHRALRRVQPASSGPAGYPGDARPRGWSMEPRRDALRAGATGLALSARGAQ
uniref:galanin receptor type 3 n=1 Tax=Myodes glareolus TaxID=447135 RepID=UPI0020202688|nr:galanin receptor type 3 [Myodes glareolus]